MNGCAIYLRNGLGPDAAIVRGLTAAGIEVCDTDTIADTLKKLHIPETGAPPANIMLVAEVQSGAIPLLTLLSRKSNQLPPTLIYDKEGGNVRPAIAALTMGVRDYLLASDPPFHRESRARVVAEQMLARDKTRQEIADTETAGGLPELGFVWYARSYTIDLHGRFIQLSMVEGRVFDLLLARRGQPVSVAELITHALFKQYSVLDQGVRVLRPHIMRLRRKLDGHPRLAHRIKTARGTGYSFV